MTGQFANEKLRAAIEAAQNAQPEPLTDQQKVAVAYHEAAHEVVENTSDLTNEEIDEKINEHLESVGITLHPEPVTSQRPVPQKIEFQIKGLDQKAVLVQLSRSMYSPYKLDKDASDEYGAGNVNKHLFTPKDCRVKKTIAAYGAVYTFVKDNTVPWSKGIDLLNIENYMDFTSGLRPLIAEAERLTDDLIIHWDEEVQKDMDRLDELARLNNKPSLANPDDYPSASELAGRFRLDIRYLPVPSVGDFRVPLLTDEDKESLERMVKEAGQNACAHVIRQMIEPMERALEKLKKPIGQDGSIFRDSLIDNLVETADRMNRINISDDPLIGQQIADLQQLVSQYAGRKDALRANPAFRATAAGEIDILMGKMKGLV